MREIKFRAWDGEKMKPANISVNGKYISTSWREFDYPVMQYTGIKDVNGVDIFEGDIVRAPLERYMDGVFVVRFSDFGWTNAKPFVKVIGNIYQNPELNPEQ